MVDDNSVLAAALRLEPVDVGNGAPAQVVYTGAAHLLVPLRDRRRLQAATPSSPRLSALLAAVGAQGCYTFALDPVEPGSAAHARFFNPSVGVDEDVATGSAAGPLASFLLAHALGRGGTELTIEQGDGLGCPSRSKVRVDGEEVWLSGRGVTVAEGRLRAPIG